MARFDSSAAISYVVAPVLVDLISSSDREHVLSLIKDVFKYDRGAADYEQIPKYMTSVTSDSSSPNHFYLTAKQGSAILGGIGSHCGNEYGMTGAWIDWLFVLPSARGLRVGRLLVEAALARLKAAGTREVYLYTSDREEEAHAQILYRHLGFQLYRTLEDLENPLTTDGKPNHILILKLNLEDKHVLHSFI